MQQRGRVTIPTDVDVVPETLTLMERWGADAIRDCDGTDYPEELRAVDAKVYSTYYTTRKDNTWAKALRNKQKSISVPICTIYFFHKSCSKNYSVPFTSSIPAINTNTRMSCFSSPLYSIYSSFSCHIRCFGNFGILFYPAVSVMA